MLQGALFFFMRRLRSLVVGLPAVLALRLAAGSESFEVPLEITDYPLPYIQVTIAGRDYRASIDTGSFRSVEISSTLARELKIPLEATTTVARRHGGKEFPLQKGRIASLRIGAWEGKDVEIDVAEGDIEAIAAQVKTPFDVILGWGFLGRLPFQVDYPDKKLCWGATPSAKPGSIVIAFEVANRVPVVDGQVDGRSLRFLFDTGAPICLLGPTSAPGVGINARTKGTLRLAEREFPLDFRVKELASRNFSGVIGNNFLLDYVITFDPAKKLIRLDRSTSAASPRRRSRKKLGETVPADA